MNQNIEIKKYHINNLDIHSINTNKFKTVISGIVFRTDLEKEFLAEKIILSSMLTKTTSKYPNEQEYIGYLRKLYDMKLYAQTLKRGKVLETSFFVTIINPKFLELEDDLYKLSAKVLKDTVLSPYLVDNKFSSNLLEKEKRLLIDEIKASYNNSYQVAYKSLINEMFKDEFYKIYSGLTIEDIEKVTIDSLTKAYYSLIKESAYVYTAGDIKEKDILDAFSDYLELSTYNKNYEYLDYENKNIDKINEIIIEKENNQSVLMIGYRVDIRQYESLYPAMVVMNGMLGGYFHSSLIKEVREKQSLAYSISSDYNPTKGFLLISLGIKHQNYDKINKIIDSILSNYCSDNITLNNELLNIFNMTKETILNDLYISLDSLLGMVNLLQLTIRFPNRKFNVDNRIKEIESVTLEDVKNAASLLKKDTIFLLKGVKKSD